MRSRVLAGVLIALTATFAGCKSNHGDPPAADNTARNERDRGVPAAKTADKAVNGPSDLDLTQKIRQAVVADGDLSTNAHNCKIIVQDGTVTLKGPVANAAESAKVEQLAATVAGEGKVVNQLEVTN